MTTYQAVGANAECHAKEFKKHKYILILDEFHHIAEGSEWHRAVKPLVDSAVLAVKMSGTLSRGDGQKIAFLGYAQGEPFLEDLATRRVIVYGRRAAIADGAILPVEFNLVDGDAEWEELDGHINTSKLSGEESAKALFTALRIVEIVSAWEPEEQGEMNTIALARDKWAITGKHNGNRAQLLLIHTSGINIPLTEKDLYPIVVILDAARTTMKEERDRKDENGE